MAITTGEIYELLSTLNQYEQIIEGKIVFYSTEEVRQRVLDDIKHSKEILKKELVRREKK